MHQLNKMSIELAKYKKYGIKQTSSTHSLLYYLIHSQQSQTIIIKSWICELIISLFFNQPPIESLPIQLSDYIFQLEKTLSNKQLDNSILEKIQLIKFLYGIQKNILFQTIQQIPKYVKQCIFLSKELESIVIQRLKSKFNQKMNKQQTNSVYLVEEKVIKMINYCCRNKKYQKYLQQDLKIIDLKIRAEEPNNKKQRCIYFNHEFLGKIKKNILRTQIPILIQLVFFILSKISDQDNQKDSSPFSTINKNTKKEQESYYTDIIENPNLYKVFFQYLQKRNVEDQSKMPFFELFIVKNTDVSIFFILNDLNFILPIKHLNQQKITLRQLQQFISQKDKSIYSCFSQDIYNVTKFIVKTFTKMSGFNLVAKRQKNQEKISKFVVDPLEFLMIKKQYWQDKFYGHLLTCALWVAVESWVKIFKIQSQTHLSNKINVEEYINIYFLVFIQFMLSMNLRDNFFIKYFPIQKSLLKDIILLPSFASLAYYYSDLFNLPWAQQLYPQLKSLINRQNGFRLTLRVQQHEINNRNLMHFTTELIVSTADQQIYSGKLVEQSRKNQVIEVLSKIETEDNKKILFLKNMLLNRKTP